MEESCLYSRHQGRDSITGICLGVPQCVGNPLQTPTGRKTNRACVFHAVWTAWHSGFDTITLIHLEKAELTLFFYVASFYSSILSSTEHEIILVHSDGPTRWVSTYAVEFKDKTLSQNFSVMSPIFYGLMATSLLQSTGERGTFSESTHI